MDVVEIDCTAEFSHVAAAWIEQWDRRRDAVVELIGALEFEQRQKERRIQLLAVEDGLLRRSLVVAARSSAPSPV